MSRKNDIDELFRNTLGDKGMPYANGYWEQMERLISAKKRNRFKRAVWFSAGLLILVSAIIVMENEVKFEEGTMVGEQQPTVNSQRSTEEKHEHMTYGRDPGQEVEKGTSFKAESGEQENADPGVRHTEKSQTLHPSGKNDMVRRAERSRNMTEVETTGGSGKMGSGHEVLIRQADRPFAEPVEVNVRRGEQTSGILTIPNLEPRTLASAIAVSEFAYTRKITVHPKQKISRSPSYNQWYIGSFINYGWIKHRSDPGIDQWKFANEKIRPYLHYGLNARVSRKGFSILVGAGMRQWTEITNYTREVDQYTFDSSLKLVNRQFIQRPDGSFAALIRYQVDTTSHTIRQEQVCQDCPVTFRYLTVPLAVHYEFGRGKWLGFAQTGMTFSFLSKTEGEYSIQWQDETGINSGMQTDKLSGRYMSPLVMQAGLTAGILYRIHPFVSVTGQVSYQRSLNSMMTLYRQESDFYGVGVGLEWKFF